MSTPRVVIADDHPVFRYGARVWLEHEGVRVVAEAGTLAELRSVLARVEVDAVILDVAFPDGDALDALPLLRDALPEVVFLVVTSHDDAFTELRAAKQGAHAFTPKETDPQHLAVMVQRLLGGKTIDSPGPTTRPVDLSRRELEVLALVARGLTNPEVAQALEVSPETVKTHLQGAFAKLGVSDRTSAAVRARELRLI